MIKKITLAFLAFLLVIQTGCESKPKNEEIEQAEYTEVQLQFDEALTEMFKETVSQDALTLHYKLIDPSIYDIELNEISLGSLKEEDLKKSDQSVLDDLAIINRFDKNELTKTQQIDYEVVKNYLELQAMSIGMDEYCILFSPSSSITSALITNFTEFRFYQAEDIEMYLSLLKDVERYLNETLAFTEKQVKLGYFMNNVGIEDTVSSIDRFISKQDDNELILSFNSKLADLDDLDENKKASFIKMNEEIVLQTVIPAYIHVKETLNSYKDSRMSDGGYASLPEGKKYYEMILRNSIGYLGDIDELFKEGEETLEDLSKTMITLLMKDASLYDRYIDQESYFENKEPEEILAQYEKMLVESYPQGPNVSYQAEYLDPSIANDYTIAYYLIPPIDNITDNVIKINPKHTSDDLATLYTTLAHEGFPGHCYQKTYYFNTNPNPIRTVYDFLGYDEGWAMMTELDALPWVLEDQSLATFLASETYFLYLIQAMSDVGVNYYGWNRQQLQNWLQEYGAIYGLEADETVEALYNSAINDPGLLLEYGFGMMKMLTIREDAMEELGKKFDMVEYHQLILESGSIPFDLMEEIVEEWIETKK